VDERILLIDNSDVDASRQHGELIIHRFPFTIGRMPSADENEITNLDLRESDLELREEHSPFIASRNHVEIGFSGGRAYVKDLGSMKGTLVNNVEVGGNRKAESAILSGGANTIQLGTSRSPWKFRIIVESGQEKPRMVVADDDETVRKLLLDTFNREFAVIPVENGYKALNACINEHPDIVLLDWQMPDIEGIKVCQTLKANVRTATLPVIMVTGMDTTPDRIRGMSVGADEYITKPFDVHEIRARVNAVVDRQRQARNQHWLSGIPSEARLQSEFDQLAASDAPPHSLITVTVGGLGCLQEESGTIAAEVMSRRISEVLWQQSLASNRTVPAQLSLNRWCLLCPDDGARGLEAAVKENLKNLLADTPASFKIKRHATAKYCNYRQLTEKI
jgi:CheY-like chemotaxis protein